MPAKRLYIETVGCQMNVLDSELVVGHLRRQGYVITGSREDADVVLFNTCSIREHAEEKVYSALGSLRRWKREKPDGVVGVLGCMAQKDQHLVLERAPFVDLVCGPGHVGEIAELLEQVARSREPVMALSLDRGDAKRREVEASFASWDPVRDPESRPTPYQAFVRTQFGCDKFCTYCIVPSVRGPEQGRDPEEILAEARFLAGQGVKEIVLIGQTVNSYRNGKVRLSDLLARVSEIPEVARVKFTTSFPNDMSDDLLEAVRDLPKVAKYLHVPAQSGCDAVLARMKRHYSVAEYVAMVDRARAMIPEVAITSDFIVGFCGETEESFAKSCDLVRRCGFKNSFIYQYSPRPGTKAYDYADDVADDVKKRRNNDLLLVQQEVSRADHARFVGREVEVLVEGPSKLGRRDEGETVQMTGRTTTDHIAVFDGPLALAGSIVNVRVEEASAFTLFGKVEGVTRASETTSRVRRAMALPVVS